MDVLSTEIAQTFATGNVEHTLELVEAMEHTPADQDDTIVWES